MIGLVDWRFSDVSFNKETSKKAVLSQIEQAEKFQEEEIVELALKDIGFI